ncbi:hypothetical protein Tbd_1052 [Thiobacillus denitrificans ATCC 25259]|uniref:Uncharacterized protein n=1 Tax=Thiobacillus denitrificans (strain ATCC 25259 / T1) TaxID=292415 RepID=Q3SJZ1_THIDA|nr:hypothetical protein [Thiobacillus denitrificans]AAZ97005.1 hypothetical protein Tbd_1052 [Thiobacillus denitrificans ATCC 25259]
MKLATGLILVPALVMGLAACDVKQTEEGKLPDVDVEGGQAPNYDVDAGDVDVGSEKKEMTVPTIDADTPAQDEAEEKAGKD